MRYRVRKSDGESENAVENEVEILVNIKVQVRRDPNSLKINSRA